MKMSLKRALMILPVFAVFWSWLKKVKCLKAGT